METYRSPKLVFLHLLMFALLYLSMIAILMLLFQHINVLFEDPLDYSPFTAYSKIRWASSVLLISYPAFLIVGYFVNKELRAHPEAKDLRIRRWLIYLTQFLSAITIIIDLIALVYNFYGGDLTARFGLKVLAVLVIAVAVFAYYRYELSRDLNKTKTSILIASITGVILLAILVAGFFIIGSPAKQRALRFDEERVQHLQSLQYEIHAFYARNNKLPTAVDELTDTTRGYAAPEDPETGNGYSYNTLDADTFELCAHFNYNSDELQGSRNGTIYNGKTYYNGIAETGWAHPAGRHCFERTLDQALLKQYLPPEKIPVMN